MSDSKIQIAVYQFNPLVGALESNVDRLMMAIIIARDAGANLFVMPELAVCGYSPEDLLLRRDFHQQIQAQLHKFLALSGITILVSCPILDADQSGGTRCYNSVLAIRDGAILGRGDKQTLPNYGVFDENRYFVSGKSGENSNLIFECEGVKIGVVICEDVWVADPSIALAKLDVDMLCVINASPFTVDKYHQRLSILQQRVSQTQLPLLYVNMVGGQDDLVFDGASVAINYTTDKSMVMQLPEFEETLAYIDFAKSSTNQNKFIPSKLPLSKAGRNIFASNIDFSRFRLTPHKMSVEASIYSALMLGLHDYVRKNNFTGVIIGLSGGIDSALTLAIAVDALGVENVMCLMMPSVYTAEISLIDARDIAKRLGVKYQEIPITQIFTSFNQELAHLFVGRDSDTTEENLQARIRGTLLMAMSNKFGYLVLTTGNKSEMAMGYATLYGDMAGGFAVLKDVSKTMVYKLCNFRNYISEVIPERIITRPPSAELRANQTDQDSLPPYDILDKIIYYVVEEQLSTREVISLGYSADIVNKVVHLLTQNEYKRRQSPLGVKISKVAFSRDWRYPVTNGFVI